MGNRKANEHWWQPPLRDVTEATRAEQFSIWALRLWWRGFPELDAVWPDLVRGFRAYGVPSAIEACHRFCSIALAAAGCGSGVGCLQCPQVAPAEQSLLEALAVAGSGDTGAVESRLRQIMPAAAARLAAPHAVHFAQILVCAGFGWPDPSSTDEARYARFALHDAPMNSDRFH